MRHFVRKAALCLEIKDIKVCDLKEYENNPRHNDNAVESVAESIKQYGFKVPIILDRNGVIVAGHTRKRAAELLGLETVPCYIAADLTPEQVKAYRLADNKTGELATWDFEKLEQELAELTAFDVDMSQFGFDEAVFDDGFSTDFELPDDDKKEIVQMTFTLHEKQAELIKSAMAKAGDCLETFGNVNSNGNALYEVVRQWAEQKTL